MDRLQEFINRQKQINKTVALNERAYHYRFFNEDDVPANDQKEEPAAPAPAADPNTFDAQAQGQNFSDGSEDNLPAGTPDGFGGETTGTGDAAGGDQLPDDGMGGDENGDMSGLDAEMGVGGAEPGMEGGAGDTEVDVTELVNSTQEVNQKVDAAILKLDQQNQHINNIIQNLGTLTPALQQMHSAVSSLANQVALLRPPTEAERREVVKQNSYPFNQDIQDYQDGVGPKTQQDLEAKTDKLSMSNILATFNPSEIKKSF